MISTVIAASISQLIVNPVLTYYLYPVFQYFGFLALDAPLPSYTELFLTYSGGFVFNDIMFYLAHRTLHSKALYFLHKQHHQYAGSMGIAAEYAGPLESVFANIIPSIGGVVVFGCHHPICIIIWLSMRLKQTYFAHSGYCFQNTILDTLGLSHADSAIFHDHHHTTNRGNFGSPFTDYIGGTMDSFVAAGGYDGYLSKKRGTKGADIYLKAAGN
jgi:methylsterol monooxygenase